MAVVRSKADVAASQRWVKPLQRRILIADVFVVTMVMVLAHGVRFGWDPFARMAGPSSPAYVWVTVAVSAMWILQLSWTHSRDLRILGQGPEEYQRVGAAGLRTFAAVAIVGFLTHWQVSRGYLLFAIPVGTLALFGYRRAWRLWIAEQRRMGRLRQRAVIVGPRRTVEQVISRLRFTSLEHSFEVVGVCLTGADAAQGSEVSDVPVLGSISGAPDAAANAAAEYIILVGTEEVSLREARRLEWALEESGIGLIVAPTVADITVPRVAVRQVAGLPFMHVEPPQFTGAARVIKEVADRVGAALALMVLSLPFAAIAIAVRISSPGPVLFRQERVGLGHEPFEMLKFRTMYVDAEERLAEIEAANEGNGVHFKMHDDPRVTPVGRFLRRLSLDELPQLINVLKGDMSIVGPRPPLAREVEKWDDHVGRRQLVKPGITGLWQVSGRSDLAWDESVRLDLHYTQNWSLGLDAIILMRTVWAVVAGRGAY
ncbi:sugar transferase [Demequina maris]|uniref:sugar transferase n=1 Tax=Demequina maris TaxID=1638982 RepID=UPI000780CA39|nr:sugar transferase [Demequina maris]